MEISKIQINETNYSLKDQKARTEIELIKQKNDEQENKLKSLSSGSPLIATQMNDMTDTSRTYVLSTDGKWYYYNGTQWVAGGIYQSSVEAKSVEENTERIDKLENIFGYLNVLNKDSLMMDCGFPACVVGSSKINSKDYTEGLTNYGISQTMKINPGDKVNVRLIPFSSGWICFGETENGVITRKIDCKEAGVYDYNLTVGENEHYMRFQSRSRHSGIPDFRDFCMVAINCDLPEIYVPEGTVKVNNDYDITKIYEKIENGSNWFGKKCGCLGTSLTANGGWTDIVKEQLGFEKMYNRGMSGSTCASFYDYGLTNYVTGHYVYSDTSRYDEGLNSVFCDETETNKTWVQGWYSSDGRINLLPEDLDLVLIDMATNDFFMSFNKEYISKEQFLSSPEIKSNYNETNSPVNYDIKTLGGAFMSMIKKIQTRCPNARIVVWGMPYNLSINSNDGSIQYFMEMYEYIENLCKLTGCYFINSLKNMGVNVWNLLEYMSDGVHVHTTEKGKNAVAKSIISELKNIYPKS